MFGLWLMDDPYGRTGDNNFFYPINLYGKKLHLPLLGEKLATMKDEKWALLDRQVLGLIRNGLFLASRGI